MLFKEKIFLGFFVVKWINQKHRLKVTTSVVHLDLAKLMITNVLA